jgi:hypothetical protein
MLLANLVELFFNNSTEDLKMNSNLKTLIALSLVATACGHKDKSDPATTDAAATTPVAGTGGGGETIAPDTTVPAAGVQISLLPSQQADALGLMDPIHYGQASAVQLKSLKYFITSIDLCQDAVLNGSGYSSTKDCISLYRNAKATDGLYERFDQAEAAKPEYDGDFKDLMKGLKLGTHIRKKNAGTYRYALVGWMKPIKVTAEVALATGKTLYTHAGTVESSVDQNGLTHQNTVIPNMTEAPAEEAITKLENGGSIVAFGAPLVITEDDVASGAQFAVDMVFNPDAMVKGADGPFAMATLTGNDGNYMSVPALSLVPLVHKTTEKVVHATYKAHASTPASPFDVRFELYYLSNTLTTDLSELAYSAHSELVLLPTTTQAPMGVANIVSVARGADLAYSFYGWQGLSQPALLGNFKRLAAVGDTGTAQMACGQSGVAVNPGECTSLDVGYELVSREFMASKAASTIEPAADDQNDDEDKEDGSGSGSGSNSGSGS